jgi:[acyl-carrier-protein] S-malonyltransferase
MPVKIAFVFPGQGSQQVGMGKELWENFDEVKSLYDEASAALGYDLRELSFNGPGEELNKTFRTQPSLLTASIAAHCVLTMKGIKPYVVAGHSLGEYSAIVAAGVLSFSDAVRLTEKRGVFMQEAVPEGKGLMAAIIGLGRNKVDELCLSVESGYVSPANYNCPGQIVIAGEKAAVEDAMKFAKSAGAKRTLPLAVSAPSHCTLMAEASNRLALLLDTIEFQEPAVPVVNNADAIFLTNSEKIKVSLVKQLSRPLLWEDSIRRIVSGGIDIFVEVGPGKVLSGLIKRIEPSVKLFNVEDMESLNRTVETILR